jgi:hypothetical protein
MPAPKGNKNAKGNKGGGAPSLNDRVLAADVRKLALTDIKDVLTGKLYADDPAYKKQILLKLAPSLLPRLNEHTGEDGDPIEQRVIYLPQRNERMEATSGPTD